MKKNLLYLIFIAFLFPVGEAGAVFLLIAPGASAAATGEAQVAKADDAYASYYNPAGLGFQKKSGMAGMHVNWLPSLADDLYYEFLAYKFPTSFGTLGGHLIFLNLGEQMATDEIGNELGKFKSYMWALDLSYGTKLTTNSGIGLGFKIFHQKLADHVTENESGEGDPYSTDFAFDISYLLRKQKHFILMDKVYSLIGIKSVDNGHDKFRFGFNIANIGPPIAFIDEDQADPAPTNMRLGFFSNLYEDKFVRFNMLMDMQKLLVATYPSMDWNNDRLIGDGLNDDSGSFINEAGQNEAAYADPWYKAWATAWLDDWFYGGDVDYDQSKYIGGYYWIDGLNGGELDGSPQPEELFDETIGNPDYPDMLGEGPYGCDGCTANENGGFSPAIGEVVLELGSKKERTLSKEFEEVIINTGFEFWYTENFVLRLGYIYDREGDIKNPTFGAGIKFDGYGFDFGYTAGEQGHPRSNSLFFSISAEI